MSVNNFNDMYNIYMKNNSIIIYKKFNSCTNDYYQYIVELIKKIINDNDYYKINILLECDNNILLECNNNKTIKININYEHTFFMNLCKGDPNIPTKYIDDIFNNHRLYNSNLPTGNIDDIYNKKYLVHIDFNIDDDIIIDYSIPNIYNVRSCEKYNSIINKHIYISPSIYDNYLTNENRNIEILTTFIHFDNNPTKFRRFDLINEINKRKLNHININNCFEHNEMKKIYENTKVLINIHQSQINHTFEELRVLPALQCGVIVIAEKSPLFELIPYNDYIIWETYENILNKTEEVINNYEYYYNLIFKKDKKIKLEELNELNYNELNNKIKSLL